MNGVAQTPSSSYRKNQEASFWSAKPQSDSSSCFLQFNFTLTGLIQTTNSDLESDQGLEELGFFFPLPYIG